MKEISNVVSKFNKSIFAQINELSERFNAVSLSQGFPDFDGPKWIRMYACRAIMEGHNQSAHVYGIPDLRQAISDNYKKYYNLNYDMNSEITVTIGATEALFSSIMALVNPGDEVIVFEPFFDTYLPAIKMAGGIPIAVTLHAPEYKYNFEELKKAFSSKTKLVITNTPHNPSGRLMRKEEIDQLAKLCVEFDSYVISDEVYEFLTFDQHQHIPLSSSPTLRERTITISSTGKTLGLTGWRIGWACAPKHLTDAIRLVHQSNTFSAPRPFQEAVAKSLGHLDDYLPKFKKIYQQKRETLCSGLLKLGFEIVVPESTYFLLAKVPAQLNMTDIEFCKYLIETCQVATIPSSAFYLSSKEGENYIRFCFAKEVTTIEMALNNLNSKFKL